MSKIDSSSVAGAAGGCCSCSTQKVVEPVPKPIAVPKAVEKVKEKTEEHKWNIYNEYPLLTQNHRSIAAAHLSREIFSKLQGEKSQKGYSFSHVIQTAIVIPESVVGATAGDEESYEKFRDFYFFVIKDWHGYDINNDSHNFDVDPSSIQLSDAQIQLFTKFIISTKVEESRNVNGHSFPGAADEFEIEQLAQKVKDALATLDAEHSGEYLELAQIEKKKAAELLANGFFFEKPAKLSVLDVSGAGRNWPKSRGIYLTRDGKGAVFVNEEDHVKIISKENGHNVISAFRHCTKLSSAIESNLKSHSYAKSNSLGYLTACPSNLGTGLKASFVARLEHLQKLRGSKNIKEKEFLTSTCLALGLEANFLEENKWTLSNRKRLGTTEVEQVQHLINNVERLLSYEEMLANGSTFADISELIELRDAEQCIISCVIC